MFSKQNRNTSPRTSIAATKHGPGTGLLSLAAVTLVVLSSPHPALAADSGAVYVLSNQASGNAVQVYHRDADGTISFARSVPTGGLGTITLPPPGGAAGIDPLASQG